ncbi:MAG TPA: transglutaminaseTgpA domain-containing protein, partial [Rubrobacteraceae bacterium]|nr:transglutaminaseTgpA domain-containing protein [Rubrobacteraceae bacterium]
VAMRSWKVRLPLYAAGLATGGAFSVLFTGGALPYMLGAALVAMLVGSAGVYRFMLLFPMAALYVVFAVYGTLPSSLGGWQGLFERVGRDLYEAARLTYANSVPYDAHPGLFVVLLPIVVIVVAFATSATLYEKSPVVSVAVLGLTIGFLGTTSFEVGIGPFFALFLVSGVALLLLTGDGARWGEGVRPVAVLAGALVVGLALALPLAPLAKEVLRPASIDWTKTGDDGDTYRLSAESDIRDYLTRGRNVELMRIKSPEPLLWRGGTLGHFDGVRWFSMVEPGGDDGEEISASVSTHEAVQKVEVLKAETSLLFGGYKIYAVSASDAQERSDGSWISAHPLAEGSSYWVISQVPQPTIAQLEAANTAYPEAIRGKFLQRPENRPEILRRTAEKIRADYNPHTPYAAARAIERYLLYDGGFTYNLNVDQADEAVEEFLGGGKEGYCVQFATSMALLSREFGVPSRVVYGAKPGEEVEPGEYVVYGRNMHTWVEVYFPGVGWYPFDPTPGSGTPATMEANAPRPEPIAAQQAIPSEETPDVRQQQPSEPAPKEEETPTDDEPTGSAEETPARASWGTYVLPPILLLALLVAVPLTKRILAARGRPDDLYRDLAGRLRDILPLNWGRATITDSPALTPTERLLLLADLTGVEVGPFHEFARAYSESLYAPDPRLNVARAYRGALREYEKLPRWKRTLGALNPASLLLRARQALAVCRARLRKTLRRRKG